MHATTTQMLQASPKGPISTIDDLAKCIDECFACAQTCTACADACLGEEDLEQVVGCIRSNLDCADICETTGHILSRQTHPDFEVIRRTVELCQLACLKCADECQRHANMHEHCRICEQACRSCEQTCQSLLSSLEQGRSKSVSQPQRDAKGRH